MKNLDLLVIIVAVIVWAVFVQVHNAGLRDDQAATIKPLQNEVKESVAQLGSDIGVVKDKVTASEEILNRIEAILNERLPIDE